ncbi:MAG: CDP-alcohol phosphatidyltransferase family protein [Oscillospiraceae bacterium]
MDRPQKKDFFTIPNILSYFRILLIPVFIFVYVKASEPRDYYFAALVIGISGLTDCLDGFIARHFNMITDVGKVLDPFADKLTQVAMIFCLASRYKLLWVLVGLLVVRESYLLIQGIIMLRRGKSLNGARWYGKVSTFVVYLVMLVLLLFPTISANFANFLIFICGVTIVLALVMYILAYVQIAREE